LASRLDAIPGIGPGRRKMLLKRFGSIEGILLANIETLTTLPGITESLAMEIKSRLE